MMILIGFVGLLLLPDFVGGSLCMLFDHLRKLISQWMQSEQKDKAKIKTHAKVQLNGEQFNIPFTLNNIDSSIRTRAMTNELLADTVMKKLESIKFVPVQCLQFLVIVCNFGEG